MDYETLSVNELVDRISEFHTKPVAVVGLLTFDFEDQSISHFPKAEQREPGHGSGLALYPSSVWLAFGGTGSLRPNERVLSRWNRKRVRVLELPMAACTRSPATWDADIWEDGLARSTSIR